MPEKIIHRVGIGGPVVKEAIAGNPSMSWVVLWKVRGEGYVADAFPSGGFPNEHAAMDYAERCAAGRDFVIMQRTV